MSRADDLAAFLEPFAEKTVEWGLDDCSAVWALWLARNGIDVDLPAYSSRDEAHAIIARHGGLIETWDAILACALFERIGPPELGDIAVIDTRLYGPIGVICAEGGVCLWRKEKGGFHWIKPRSFLKIWAVA